MRVRVYWDGGEEGCGECPGEMEGRVVCGGHGGRGGGLSVSVLRPEVG